MLKRKIGGNLYIIDQREKYSMISSWTEYLCIEKNNNDDFELSVRGASILEEANQFFDVSKQEYILPSMINGNSVYGMSDGVVFGEPLEIIDDIASPISLNSRNIGQAFDWLEIINWKSEDVLQSISDIVLNKNI